MLLGSLGARKRHRKSCQLCSRLPTEPPNGAKGDCPGVVQAAPAEVENYGNLLVDLCLTRVHMMPMVPGILHVYNL